VEKRIVQITITAGAVGVLVGHVVAPQKFDAFALACLVVAALPWLGPVFSSIKLPGGLEVAFPPLKAAGEAILSEAEVTASKAGSTRAASLAEASTPAVDQTLVRSWTRDTNLDLVALRIEAEKLLADLSTRAGMRSDNVSDALVNLRAAGYISNRVFDALLVIMSAGNTAVHGGHVDEKVGAWARAEGSEVLRALQVIARGALAARRGDGSAKVKPPGDDAAP
jgi:hypothetical protein